VSRRSRLHFLRAALVVAAVAVAAPEAVLITEPDFVDAQQLGEGMVRTGTVGIRDETEKRLFFSLICTCGCPRETLGTCTCGTAHARRDELRELLADGKGIEDIKNLYAQRYGMQGLAVPPSKGIGRAVWAVPIVAMLMGAGGVLLALRKWKKRGDGDPAAAKEGTGGGSKTEPRDVQKREELDARIDRELEDLDR
jgi:cytochrome c-type biogenesis protein CcmH